MNARRAVFLFLRFVFLALSVMTWAFGMLASVPFTYTQVIQAGLVPWLAPFARMHGWIYLAGAVVAALTLVPDLREKRMRLVAGPCAAVLVAAGAALVQNPLLPTLEIGTRSAIWAHAALVPPVLLAAVDAVAVRGKISWGFTSTREDASIFRAGLLTLGVVVLTYSGIFHVRAAGALGLSLREEGISLAWSLLLHASFAGLAFAIACLVRGLAAWIGGQRALADLVAICLAALAGIALLVYGFVARAISLQGTLAVVAAASVASACVASLAGLALRDAARDGTVVESGLRLAVGPLSWPHAPRVVRVLWLLALIAVAVRLQIVASRMDWNGLMQRLSAVGSATMIFAAALALFRVDDAGEGRTSRFVALACAGMLGYGAWRTLGHPADTATLRTRLAASEPSFGFLHAVAGGEGYEQSMASLFQLMQRSTGLPPERRIEPLDVKLSDSLGQPSSQRQPNIFIFTIDSLRRDYLSPYNKAVTFTPNIQKFAETSDVFENAFTHYGATGLSEPSIWVGGMMPHKQYITPFSPMNSLEKLVLSERYARIVSLDSILAQLLDAGPSLDRMDEHRATGEYDLCATVEELIGKVQRHRDQPIFSYTQPQNIHVSRITAEGATVPPGASYPGFYPPYASRLERVDGCFGQFIEFLRAQGMYDESIVVLTADHGELLGEAGLWGHAYMLSPEIVRIPLVVHRPARLRGAAAALRDVVFSTDIAPSLYQLLGHPPAKLGPIFGQSLYAPREAGRGWYLLVSSYGPVYGILEDEGRHLYVADAVARTDDYYEVASGSTGPRKRPSEEDRSRNGARIAEGIEELHATYRVPEPAASKSSDAVR
jgi:hypothetical protein